MNKKISVVSLSSGIIGEKMCEHQRIIGEKRIKNFGYDVFYPDNALKGIKFLKNNPDLRFEDLKDSFLNKDVEVILSAIGGDDSFKLIPYIMNKNFKKIVKNNYKKFVGFSDSTIVHLCLNKIGLKTFYGQTFLTDIAELDFMMLEDSETALKEILENKHRIVINSSPKWFEERTDFSPKNINKPRISHIEKRGIEFINFKSNLIEGELFGGCLESIYECFAGERFIEQPIFVKKYKVLTKKDFKNKIIFLETSEEKPNPEKFKKMICKLQNMQCFKYARCVVFGKPQDEIYYEEYKNILIENLRNIPIVFNVNFGHALPRKILPYGWKCLVNSIEKTLTFIDE